MKRFGKILLIAAGIMVALVAIAMTALLLFFDPNDYRRQIDATIEQQIGREVDIKGDIRLSVFPWLGLETGRVTVANATGFGDRPMAELRSAELNVKLVPLLSRRIEVGTVSLDGLRLRLARNADGRSNWAGISERLASDQSANSESGSRANAAPGNDSPSASGGSAGSFSVSWLQIDAVKVQDAAIRWQDAQSGSDYRATGVDLSTGRLADGQPFRLNASGNVAAPNEKIDAALDLAARIEPNISQRFYRFSDLELNVLATGRGVPGKRQQATLSGSGELDMADGRLRLPNVGLQAAGLNISGNLDASGLNAQPSGSGRITVRQFDPRAVMKDLGIQPPETRSESALSKAGFDASFRADADRIVFKQILATLDDSSLKGSASVKDLSAPAAAFDLTLDKLNADQYRPPASQGQDNTNKSGNSKSGSTQGSAEIDLSALRNLKLDGKLAIGSLVAANIHVNDARLAVKARNGVLTVAPLTANLYQGKLKLTVRVDASKDTPRYALKGRLNGLQFQPLLKDAAGMRSVGARTSMNIDLDTAGTRLDAIKRALDGTFGFTLRDGAFHGFNLAQVIEAARRRVSGASGQANESAGVGSDKKTPFNRFAASFDVRDGVLSGKDLELTSPVIDATGSGNYDLAANALDYTIDARIPDDASGKLEDLAGVTVPIKLSGSLMSPDYSLDVASALKSAAAERLNKEKSKLQDKIDKKLDEQTQKLDPDVRSKVEQGLNSLFGGDKDDDE